MMIRHLIHLSIVVIFISCMQQEKTDNKRDVVFDEFKSSIEKIGLKIDSVDNEGLIYISKDEWTLKVSLDNIRRNYQQDNDLGHVHDLVASLEHEFEPIPEWNIAKNKIFVSLFPSDYDFSGIPHTKITADFCRLFVFYNSPKIIWIDNEQIKDWGITEGELIKQAEENMNKALENSTFKTDTVEGHVLGYIESDLTFKSALLFSEGIKKKVEQELGWPIYCVLPIRDICYLFSEQDKDYFMQRLGPVVLNEFESSGYPITTEVIKISDEGVEVVGKYKSD